MKSTNRIVIAVALAGLTFAAAGAGATSAKKVGRNQRIIERWFALVDAHDTEHFGEVEAADIEMKLPFGPMKGTQSHAQLTKMFATAFPNFKHTVTRCVEAGDEIACEGHFTGDHTGPMSMPTGQAIPPTGRHVAFDWSGMATIKGGKVSAVNVYFDVMGFMQQLGVVPPPAPISAR